MRHGWTIFRTAALSSFLTGALMMTPNPSAAETAPTDSEVTRLEKILEQEKLLTQIAEQRTLLGS